MGTSTSKEASMTLADVQDTVGSHSSGDSFSDDMDGVHNFQKGLTWYRTDCNFDDVYETMEVIGEGSTGEVSIVQKKVNSSISTIAAHNGTVAELFSLLNHAARSVHFTSGGRLFACKTVVTPCMTDAEMEEFLNEIDILRDFDHPNIVQLFEVYRVGRKIWLVMELCAGGDLESRMGTMTEEKVAVVMEQLFSGLCYMHLRNVSHCDLKLENIMYENNRDDAAIKLIDFGLSQHITTTDKTSRAVGTIYTVAPEVLMGQPHTTRSDAWSAGVLAFILLSGEYPFLRTLEGLQDESAVSALLGARYASHPGWLRRGIGPRAREFVGNLLRPRPHERWTAVEALRFIQQTWIPHLLDKAAAGAVRHHDALGVLHRSTALMRKRVRVTSTLVQALSKFGEYRQMKQMILITLAYTMDKSSLGDLKDIFLSFDSKNTGTLSLGELRRALRQYSQANILTDAEIEKIFVGMDYDRSGQIHYIQFLAAIAECTGQLTVRNLAEAFDRLDADNSGCITRENLAAVLGVDPRDGLLTHMIEEADTHRTGRIDYSQFLGLMFPKTESPLLTHTKTPSIIWLKMTPMHSQTT